VSTRCSLFYGRFGHIYRDQWDDAYYYSPPSDRGMYRLVPTRLWAWIERHRAVIRALYSKGGQGMRLGLVGFLGLLTACYGSQQSACGSGPSPIPVTPTVVVHASPTPSPSPSASPVGSKVCNAPVWRLDPLVCFSGIAKFDDLIAQAETGLAYTNDAAYSAAVVARLNANPAWDVCAAANGVDSSGHVTGPQDEIHVKPAVNALYSEVWDIVRSDGVPHRLYLMTCQPPRF
jgi:hypothetical protein